MILRKFCTWHFRGSIGNVSEQWRVVLHTMLRVISSNDAHYSTLILIFPVSKISAFLPAEYTVIYYILQLLTKYVVN